ncbi:MAG: IMP cyclohydrolase [Halodesulfurarchaeum sp.]
MYIGRFLVLTPDLAAYRVSSRSFPNRTIVERNDALTVRPTPDAPETDNPYISYNCVRLLEDAAVVGNGTHVDHIAEKQELGYPARDALALGLLALDFERDEYDTPRIAGVLGPEPTVGIVRRDAVLVRSVDRPTLVATYERDEPETYDLEATTPDEAAQEVFDAPFEHPVAAAGVARADHGFETAVVTG